MVNATKVSGLSGDLSALRWDQAPDNKSARSPGGVVAGRAAAATLDVTRIRAHKQRAQPLRQPPRRAAGKHGAAVQAAGSTAPQYDLAGRGLLMSVRESKQSAKECTLKDDEHHTARRLHALMGPASCNARPRSRASRAAEASLGKVSLCAASKMPSKDSRPSSRPCSWQRHTA